MISFEAYKGIAPGKVISRELDKRKIRQCDFAVEVGMHSQTLNNVIKGHRKLTLPQALSIERALGLEQGFLMILQLYYEIDKFNKSTEESSEAKPNVRKILFWDIDFDKLDWKKHKDFILKRVKERGNDSEKVSVAQYYHLKNL